MASKRSPYETKTVTTTVFSPRKLNKYIRKGWEVVSSNQRGIGGVHDHTLRRPNPKYKPKD